MTTTTNGILTITISDIDLAANIAPRYMLGAEHPGTIQSSHAALELLAQYLQGVAAGNRAARVLTFLDQGDGTAATGQIVCTRANAAGDTVTIAGVTFTETSTPSAFAGDGQFARGATDTTCGDNLAAAINAHPMLTGMLTAADVAGTITLTAVDKGTHGNLIVMSTSDATAFALTQMASGANGTVSQQTRIWRRGR